MPTNRRDKNNGSIIWKCKCDCGNICYVAEGNLSKLEIRSCGCLAKDSSSKLGKTIGSLTKEKCVYGTNIRNLTMKLSKRNKSGIKGVSWDSNRNRWVAQIKFQGKNYNLGRFKKKEDAAKVRKIAEEKIFGEFLKWYEENYKGRN